MSDKSSQSGVHKKALGYPTPKDPKDVIETAEMTLKASYRLYARRIVANVWVSVGQNKEERLRNSTLSDLGHPNVGQARSKGDQRGTVQWHMSVLENGLSLIAVNLPSLWCLFTKVKPESILRSVRGRFSLHSRQPYTTSVGKPGLHSRLSSLSNNEPVLTSSPSHSGHPKVQSIETYAMYDIDERDQGARLPQGQIQITDRITQSAVHV
ncbi:hypothetical protein MMC22_005847 [Lobaria immixta]|nr:hypothetical protein [Lobaria immixta]